ncbi:hypothetical protein Tco_0807093, partial [Tanacetum coccineum]
LALQIELLRERPTTLGEAFSLARITETHFEDENNQAVNNNVGDQEDPNVNDKQEVKKADDQDIKSVKDEEGKTYHGNSKSTQENGLEKNEDDDQSFAEEDSYLSGDQYFLSILMDEDELNLLRPDFVRKEFISQTDEFIMLTEGQILGKTSMVHMDDFCIDEDQHGSVRLIGVAINSDVADFGSEVRDIGSLGVCELWKSSFASHIKTIMWFKKESISIQERIWDLRIKIFQDSTLRTRWFLKEW